MSPELRYTFRSAKPEDDESVLAFMRQFDMLETGEIDSDMEDLHFDWSQINLSQDTCLAQDSTGLLRAYAAILPWGNVDLRYLVYDDLQLNDDSLWKQMAEFCQTRALELRTLTKRNAKRSVMHCSHANERHRNLLEKFGFNLSRYVFQLQISLKDDQIIPVLPEGYRLTGFELEKDEHALYKLIQHVFSEPGHDPQSFSDWKAFMMRGDLFNPDLWQLVWFEGEIAGACLPVPYPELGWIRQLGVSEKHRRKGLGRILLMAGFRSLRKAGYEKAGLAVHSKNPNAHALYLSAGMTLRNQIDEYEKNFLSD